MLKVKDGKSSKNKANKKIAIEFYRTVDAIGSGKAIASAFDDIAANTFQAHLPGGGSLDREGFKDVINAYRTGFPGAVHTIEDIMIEDNHIAVRITWRGKHTGKFQDAPATNNTIEMSEMGMMRIENGKVIEFWPLFDSMTLMNGIGVVKK